MRWIGVSLGALLLLGCAKKKGSTDQAVSIEPILRAHDQQWEQRARIGLDDLEPLLVEATSLRPDDPELLWRRARLAFTRGLACVEEAECMDALARARQLGFQCLDDGGTFKQHRQAGEWEEASREIPQSRVLCGGYAAASWAKWLQTIGSVAAASDLTAVEILCSRVSRAKRIEAQGLGAYACGVTAAIQPSWRESDPEAATSAFAQAREDGAVGLWVDTDELLLVARPSGATARIAELEQRLQDAEALTPEDARARQHGLGLE